MINKNILVTGGAGYIGSITARELKKSGFNPVIYDSLEKGHREAIEGLDFVKGDTHDYLKLLQVLKDKNIKGVIHFAAYIEMAESMENPFKYFDNNYFASLTLFRAMQTAGVKNCVFSSTAGVYQESSDLLQEDDAKTPSNPYGLSKLMTEQTLSWLDKIYAMRSVVLRYFNAAGADRQNHLGESHSPESHLIPSIIYSILRSEPFTLFGRDYDSKDGTCIRDYIHVLDLARFHVLALEHLFNGGESLCLNAGTGHGYSNQEVLSAVENISGKRVNLKIGQRRPGDAVKLVADNSRIIKAFSYRPLYSDLKNIVQSAWEWHKNQVY